jgi:hypothetical protein
LSTNDHALTQQTLKFSITAVSVSRWWNEVFENVKGEIRQAGGAEGYSRRAKKIDIGLLEKTVEKPES